MGEMRNAYKMLIGRLEGKRSLGSPGVDGKISLKQIFKKWGARVWNEFPQDSKRWRALKRR
jgi:hypothetical protein